MARIKSRVTTAQASPKSTRAGLPPLIPNHSMRRSSESASSSAISSTCPHCISSFSDMTYTDFRDHVASCTRPSTADDDDSSDSELTPPPESPSVYKSKNGKGVEGDDPAQISLATLNRRSDKHGATSNGLAGSTRPIRPYINPKTSFDYYDKVDEREGSLVATRRNSEEPEGAKSLTNGNPDVSSEEKFEAPKIRYPFPKFTPIEAFEDYLANPEEKSYEDLYDCTAHVSDILVNYQKEWDEIEKEIFVHESYIKAQTKKAAELAKEAEEEKAKVEDQKYIEIAEAYRTQLRLSRSDWERYLESLEESSPKDTDLLDRLRSLRLPNFLSSVYKRQKGREPEPIKLIERPLMAERITKEELALDKRKRGKLMDKITFEDMKHADVYGFNYSSQPHHVGNQPQPTLNGKSKGRIDMSEEGRSRSQRNKAQRSYDADKSVTPETESDELPAKRSRKPRMNLDISVEPERRAHQSRSGSPAVRTFPSGKRVGRPPAKSKLKDVQVPPQSASPASDNVTGPRMLAPKQEEQLHDAAESLVNQTRHPHARSPSADSSKNISGESSRSTTSSSIEGKERKRGPGSNEHGIMSTQPDPYSPILPPNNANAPYAPSAPSVPKGRKRKVKEEVQIDESLLGPEAAEALRKKRIKSAKLSESLRKRWEKGEMAGAMETRKATNAAKKAAKAAAAGGPIQPLVQAPIVPTPIAPLPPPPKAIQLQPSPFIIAETQTPKRKHSQANKQALQNSQSSQISTSSKGSPPSSKGKKRVPPVLPPARLPSTRTRRPTRLIMGDGPEEEIVEQEIEHQFKSEYDHYQALTSPRSPVVLGKRVRKSKINLAAAMSEDNDDGEDYF